MKYSGSQKVGSILAFQEPRLVAEAYHLPDYASDGNSHAIVIINVVFQENTIEGGYYYMGCRQGHSELSLETPGWWGTHGLNSESSVCCLIQQASIPGNGQPKGLAPLAGHEITEMALLTT